MSLSETKAFYGTIADRCENQGFQIVYGPPFVEAPVFFIGYQPGPGLKSPEEERRYGSEDGWVSGLGGPSRCEYATENWALAKNMRLMFPQELLERCVGLNAIFVRSPRSQHYRSHVEAKVAAGNRNVLPRQHRKNRGGRAPETRPGLPGTQHWLRYLSLNRSHRHQRVFSKTRWHPVCQSGKKASRNVQEERWHIGLTFSRRTLGEAKPPKLN